ncbi:efflux RND transporter periplasmic adaptor subunit [Plesiomonas shigelloides]|uniref:efflux RND transporter periplasmic adaptor subunit n=1 Tax=Plesiomonas shigelloides TaxID=703 RepID=UPI001C498C57
MQKRPFAYATLLTVLTASLLTGCKEAPPEGGHQMPPAAVDVITLQQAPLQLTTDLTGRTSALRIAEVRPQVSGLILKRLFTEGSDVKAGDVLYQIDPALYEADVASASAALARAQASARTAELRLKRYVNLLQKHSISQQEYDDADAQRKQAQADVLAAQANLKRARINLGYTKITAPISGRIGTSAVTEGALVTAQQGVALTTIQQLDPMYVDVRQSTADLLRLKQWVASGKVTAQNPNEAPVSLFLEDSSAYPQAGVLQFSDVTVDENTGMVSLRVVVPNPQQLLMPGMFIRARLSEGVRENGLLVPQVAVSRTPKGGASVLVVDSDNKVSPRDIQVSRMIGTDWVVESGLKAGERVIIAGLQKVAPGAQVNPTDKTAAASQDATPAPTTEGSSNGVAH